MFGFFNKKKKKPIKKREYKTVHRWLSAENIKKLSKGYAIEVQVNGQRISLKARAKKCQ